MKEYFTVTQLANIDSLVHTEGEEGTPVGNCYLNFSINGDPDFFICAIVAHRKP